MYKVITGVGGVLFYMIQFLVHMLLFVDREILLLLYVILLTTRTDE